MYCKYKDQELISPSKKLCAKYFMRIIKGPYKIKVKVKPNNSYDMMRKMRRSNENKYMDRVHKTMVYCTVIIRCLFRMAELWRYCTTVHI